jgi:hypothetical protein
VVTENCFSVTSISDFSAITTTILWRASKIHKYTPIWWTSSAGRCPKEIWPFLRDALKEAHCSGNFIGGRGKPHYFKDGMKYINNVHDVYHPSTFDSFEGQEVIYNDKQEQLGFHKYFGMALI